MKKITLALVAVLLVMGMTQCKKEQPTPTPEPTPDGETVYISMKVDDGGSKHIVYPGTGAYVFQTGDKIYVGNNGKYVGTLTYNDGRFSGSITNPSTTDYLHFYFTGGKTPSTTPTAGSTTSFTVNISSQINNLPVLSYGHSTSKYIDGTTTYTCMLENKCGLVKFKPSIATYETIIVSGMKTVATIDFATPGITPTDATGEVTLYPYTTINWAILLPQEEVVNPTVTIGSFKYPKVTIPAITTNMYYNTGVNIMISPIGAINSVFTINSSGNKVNFSQGNLQYQASSDTWRFAINQFDYIGYDNSNISNTYNGWIDLFGWGTSGWDNGNTYYHPYDSDDTYGGSYGPRGLLSLTGDYAEADWGVHNAISNGSNSTHFWRTLTDAEWKYVLNTRETTSGIRYAKAVVNNVNGIVLLPDDWTEDFYTLNSTNTASADFTNNVISASEWTNHFEFNGAVFLPTTGMRQGTDVPSNPTTVGSYWSSSSLTGGTTYEYARYWYFYRSNLTFSYDSRARGMAVRLVHDVQ